jgi:hypothetical protein
MSPEIAVQRLLELVTDTTFVPFAVGLVVVLTQLLKQAISLTKWQVSPALLALAVQVAVWVAYSIAKANGYELKFEQSIGAAETILTALLSVVAPGLLSLGASHLAYEKFRSSGVAGFKKAA